MSRIIKFRAWSKNIAMPGSNEFMEYSDKIGLMKFFSIYPKQGVVMNGAAERFIMQFTGLLDKNGKEIYEGDILQYSMPNMEGDGSTTYTELVHFENGSFELDGCPCYVGADIGEVIGNIHENPELQNE